MTAVSGTTLNAEAQLTFDGNKLITQQTNSDIGLLVQNTTHDSQLRIEAQAANKNSVIMFADGSDGDVGMIDYDHNDNSLSFTVNTSERLRIYSTGRILIGNGASEQSPAGNLDIVGDINGNGGELYLRVSNNDVADNIGALLFGNNVDKSVVKIQGTTHTANNTGDLQFHTSTSGTMSEKLRITNAGWLSIYSNTGTIGNPSVPLHITTTSSQEQLFYFYKGSSIVHRVAHNSVSDNFGSGSRTYIGDTNADLYLGTANSSLSPTSSFIGINHNGTIRMCAGASPQAEEGIILREHSLQYNVTSNLNTNGNDRTSNDKVSIRAGLMNSTTVNDNVTAIKIFPAGTRNSTTYTKGGGIAWQHLDPHNWNGYSGAQFWLGMSLHSTPGQEYSYLETWHNTQTSPGSQPNNVGLRIFPNGNVTTPSSAAFLAGGVNNYSGFPGNGVWKNYYTNTEYFDRGDDFDHSTGTFTAPADGAYFFHVSGLIYPMGATNFGQGKWVKNGSQYGQYIQFNGTDGNHRNFSYEIVMEMSTNDTCNFQIWRTSGQSWTLYNSQFNFGGFLIG